MTRDLRYQNTGDNDDDSDQPEPSEGWLRKFLNMPGLGGWIAMIFSLVAALAELLRAVLHSREEAEIISGGVLISALVGMLLFMAVQWSSLVEYMRKYDREKDRNRELMAKYKSVLEDRDRSETYQLAIAREFVGVAVAATTFRTQMLNVACRAQGSERLVDTSPAELHDKLKHFLGDLGTAGVNVLATRKRPKQPFHINFKGLESYPNSPDTRYRILARSKNPIPDRVLDEDRRQEPCRLDDNEFYQKILIQHGKTDHLLVGDVKEALRADDCLPDPHSSVASRFYGSCLVSAIIGPRADLVDCMKLPFGKAVAPFGDDRVLLGFVCVDCLEKNAFDDNWDLDVMRQVAAEAFDVILHYYYALGTLPPASSVKLVPPSSK